MIACGFPITAPGLLHLATILITSVCVVLGFMTHLHAAWVHKQEYRLCDTTEKVWKQSTDVECPNISLETAFLIMIVICLVSSIFWYSCELCCIGGSRSAALFYVVYLVLAAITLIIAGILYIKSAEMINKLPPPDYTPVIQNIGKVLVAAFSDANSADNMHLVSQSDEQSYYQEKLATGALTMINGVLHVICAWLAVIDLRH